MAILQQDIHAILDPTGLTTLNASQIYQITDTSIPASDKGLIVESTDTALDTPLVPNANVTTKWKRYIWKRVLFDGSTKLYQWNNSLVSNITFLKWEDILSGVEDAISIAQDAANLADEAK